MNTYKVTYLNRNFKSVTVTRKAETAWDAAEKVSNQYGWGIEFNMVDADTRGQVWGSGFFKVWDKVDGTSYGVSMYTAKLAE